MTALVTSATITAIAIVLNEIALPQVFTAPADWSTAWLRRPAYAVWAAVAQPLAAQADWPEQAALDALFAQARAAGCPLPPGLRCVLDLQPDAYYESHIAATGQVPTRARNWHDLFNALAWLAWPRLKTALNARHQAAIAAGEAKRGPIRDSATLLDECGLLMPYAEQALAEAVDGMRWGELWQDRRADWGRLIDAYPLGHALPEMLLAPFIGLTGKAWLLPVDASFFTLPFPTRLARLDALAAERLSTLDRPSRLAPLPVLGIPGWHAGAQDAGFYANADYFRPSRRAPSVWAA